MACYFIEPGWEKVLEGGESVWISRKSRTEGSFHGDVKLEGSKLILEDDSTFEGSLAGSKILNITWANHNVRFIAPQKWFNFKKSITSIDVSEGGLGVFSSGEIVYVFDTKLGDIRREFTQHVAELYTVRLFPSGVVGLSNGADMQLKIWSCADGKCPVTLTGHTKAVTCTSIIERGRNIASVSKDGTARLWNCGSSKCLGNIELGESLNTCAIIAKNDSSQRECIREEVDSDLHGKLLISGGEEGGLCVVDLPSQSLINRYKCDSAINILANSQKQLFAGCENGEVKIFDISDLSSPVNTTHDSNSPVLSLVVLGDGFVVGRSDGTVAVYKNKCSTSIYLTGPDNERVSSLSKDDDYIYTGSRDGCIRKYSLENTVIR